MIKILLFYFVAVCNPDTDLCERYSAAPRWPGFVSVQGAYDVEGPFFTLEDCKAASALKHVAQPIETPFGPVMVNPWGDGAQSLCYAREIQVTLPS